MKYIEIPALSHLAQSLTHEGPECSVHTRMEAYSCKNIKRDKKLFKTLESAYQDDVSNSPPLPSWLALDREAEMTPFGPIDKHASRKTLYLLIATLNVAFPDHEFSDVRPSHFVKEEDGANILNALSNTLISPHRAGSSAPRTYSSYPPTSPDFFPSSESSSTSPYERKIPSPPRTARDNDVIGLSECEVFSYTPEIDADPHANDFSDDEDDVASIADEASSSDEDGTFEFDNYDIDEIKPRSYSSGTKIPPADTSSGDKLLRVRRPVFVAGPNKSAIQTSWSAALVVALVLPQPQAKACPLHFRMGEIDWDRTHVYE
ncbi:hypothetical protein NLJ89_g11101 [Agrocybe chaxingu]|uniref:Repressor of RNA polymerase III transcription MAF1 n=1 Tax=Agrocybe chaxingu TaxID=84603 RepID=A0A9W8JWX3_9AGAR|nr:hypothetical protein NLJ89_g11101 [Agrocybe chaxingu]